VHVDISALGSYVAAWLATIGTLWMLFERAGRIASPEAKQSVRRWLRREVTSTGMRESWPRSFAQIFDTVFGVRHISWRCFWRSSIASFTAVIITVLLWIALMPDRALFLLTTEVSHSETFGRFLGTVLAAGIINLIPDYISLLETRLVIRMMEKKASLPWGIGLLVLDIFLTIAIFIGILMVCYLSITQQVPRSLPTAATIWTGLKQLAAFEEFRGAPPGIMFYSTFFTSVWLWLYAGSGLMARLVESSLRGFVWIRRLLNVDKEPVLAAGTLCIAITTCMYILAAPLVIL
jgi:uncharacterized protein